MRYLRLFIFLLLTSGPLCAQSTDNFSESTIRGPWSLPVGITFDELGQGYIWDMLGKVFVMDTSGQVLNTPLLDISEEVAKWLDQGMVGFALDPNFIKNGYFYVMYPVDAHYEEHFGTPTYDPRKTITHTATFGRITRYTANVDSGFRQIIPNSRHIVLGKTARDGFPILFDSHGLGTLAFGTDGSLLASCGDGANSIWTDTGSNGGSYFKEGLERGIIRPAENIGAFRSQMINSLAGKIIRIDPETGAGLPGNPFYDPENRQAAYAKVWTLGLRNPFKFLVVPETGSHDINAGRPGTILCGDVGESAWEELNSFDQPGQNAGWPIYEGLELSPSYGMERIAHPEADCPDQITFDQLLQPDHQNRALPTFDCLSTAAAQNRVQVFKHRRPILTYQNENKNANTQAATFLPGYNLEGNPVIRTLDTSRVGAAFQGDASMAGFFYSDKLLPDAYQDAFFQVDYAGWIRVYQFGETNPIEKVRVLYEGGDKLVAAAAAPGEAAIYFLSLGDRSLHKLTYGGHRSPIAAFEMDRSFGASPLRVKLDASASQGFDSDLDYFWDFGEGQTSTLAQPEVMLEGTGRKKREIKLIIEDTLGGVDSLSRIVFLNNTPPLIHWQSPADTAKYPLYGSTLLNLLAEATDRESPETALDYCWEVFLHHNTHFHPSTEQTGAQAYAILAPLGCETEAYWYRIQLTVTDEDGLSTTTNRLLYPNCEALEDPFFQVSAFAKNKTVRLEWNQLDFPIQYYEIERSRDYFLYEKIATTQSLDFTDQPAGQGTFIYRIKAVGEDGAFWYTAPVERELPQASSHRLSPNPTSGDLRLQLPDFIGEQFLFTIYDVQGRQVWQQEVSRLPEGNSGYDFDIKLLGQGQYFYTIRDEVQQLAGQFIKL